MPETRDEPPRVAWLTNDGELILFDELVSEVRAALSALGHHLDAFPLACALTITQDVTHELAEVGQMPTSGQLTERILGELRSQRVILTTEVVRAVLTEYLRQLRRLDIARVQYY